MFINCIESDINIATLHLFFVRKLNEWNVSNEKERIQENIRTNKRKLKKKNPSNVVFDIGGRLGGVRYISQYSSSPHYNVIFVFAFANTKKKKDIANVADRKVNKRIK